MLEKIKEISFNISTLFGLGELFGCFIVLAVLAFPFIFLFSFLKNILSFGQFYLLLIILFFLYLLIMFLALNFITEKDKGSIVLNRLVGLIIVF